MPQALLIGTDGEGELREVAAEGVRQLVGGWLEEIGLGDTVGFCDDDAKRKGVPVNLGATMYARALGWRSGGPLRGPVLFVGRGEDGELVDLGTDALLVWQTLTADDEPG